MPFKQVLLCIKNKFLYFIQKGGQWVSSSFGDFDFDDTFAAKVEPKKIRTVQPTLKSSLLSQRSLPVKRKLSENVKASVNFENPVSRRTNKQPETSLWADKHAPNTQVCHVFLSLNFENVTHRA